MADGKQEMHKESVAHDETLPLLDADRRARDSIHVALLEDKTPEILFHEDAIADTDSEHEDDDTVSVEGSIVLDDDAKLLMFKSTGRVGSKERWGQDSLDVDSKMMSVSIDMSDGLVVKVEGWYHSEQQKESTGRLRFELHEDEFIIKVYLFRIRRQIHAIQFVTNKRKSDRFGKTRHGELCKVVEAPEGKCIASFFGDISRGDEDINLGLRFAYLPEGKDTTEADADVAEIDHVS
ncbi:hypothetical protein PsorP6_013850 [Peronosclerospora sorghi]|uniref:Uncharacterized protein n=1 Tax=Peronosclerospora sorghi TaxID=230839 RepID=A0ACC0VGF5_9STRA|nr:hypothetical protein PsorP6_013850 [Peronosclerospora sorghi]